MLRPVYPTLPVYPTSLDLKKHIEQLGFGLDWDDYTHLRNCRYKYLYPVFQIVSDAT